MSVLSSVMENVTHVQPNIVYGMLLIIYRPDAITTLLQLKNHRHPGDMKSPSLLSGCSQKH